MLPFHQCQIGEPDDGSRVELTNIGLLPRLDDGLSALLARLSDRVLVRETTILVTGEFGRTRKINTRGGRDHWSLPGDDCPLLRAEAARQLHLYRASSRLMMFRVRDLCLLSGLPFSKTNQQLPVPSRETVVERLQQAAALVNRVRFIGADWSVGIANWVPLQTLLIDDQRTLG